MINPKFVEKHRKEAKAHGVNLNEAWDDVDYIDLEVDDDFFQKALAIRAGEEYSTDISVPIDLPDELLLFAFKAAHEENMTFNDYVNRALRNLIDEYNANPDALKEKVDQYKISKEETVE